MSRRSHNHELWVGFNGQDRINDRINDWFDVAGH